MYLYLDSSRTPLVVVSDYPFTFIVIKLLIVKLNLYGNT